MIQVSLDSTDRLVDLQREDVDLALRYGRGKWPHLRAERLVQEWLTPACSPDFLRDHVIHAPRDLTRVNLINDRTMLSDLGFPTWETWFAVAGVATLGEQSVLHFSSSITAIQAAVEGHGVVLGRSVAVDQDLRAGRLILPFPELRVPGYAYYVVYRPEALESQKVAAFKEWVLEAFEDFTAFDADESRAVNELG
jgi:LysR family glycine cleavage system transcriptional activator